VIAVTLEVVREKDFRNHETVETFPRVQSPEVKFMVRLVER
jgi:hypothetical protein